MLLSELFSSPKTLSLTWSGNAGWLIQYDNRCIAIDLDLMSERLWQFPVSFKELAQRLDFSIATHSHGDHFNIPTAKALIDGGSCTLILPRSCADSAAEASISESRIIWAEPKKSFEPAPWLRIEPTRALHGHTFHSVFSEANFDDCGYVVSIGGKRLYHPGDSVLLQDHFTLKNIDVLFVSPTEHNTHIEGSKTLIEAINPSCVFAQHFGTYPVTEGNAYWTTGYEEPLRMSLSSKHRSRYTIPEAEKIYRL